MSSFRKKINEEIQHESTAFALKAVKETMIL